MTETKTETEDAVDAAYRDFLEAFAMAVAAYAHLQAEMIAAPEKEKPLE